MRRIRERIDGHTSEHISALRPRDIECATDDGSTANGGGRWRISRAIYENWPSRISEIVDIDGDARRNVEIDPGHCRRRQEASSHIRQGPSGQRVLIAARTEQNRYTNPKD